MNYIISIATIPKRLDYFKKSFQSIIHQTAIDKISEIIVNVDDNITNDELKQYDFLNEFLKVKVIKRLSKWKSANKLIWTYMDHKDDIIIAFDDDKDYPLNCIEELIKAYIEKGGGLIVCEESNPTILRDDDFIEYRNDVEITVGQLTFSKYLSNACLFPPHCFGDGKLLTDYDKMMEMTKGTHDELWFWLVSTLNKVYSYQLNSTYGCAIDGGNYKLDEVALSNINCKPERIHEYNIKVNEMFGKELLTIYDDTPIIIPINRQNYEAVFFGMGYLHMLYGNYKVKFVCDESIKKSHIYYICNSAKNYKWKRKCIIEVPSNSSSSQDDKNK